MGNMRPLTSAPVRGLEEFRSAVQLSKGGKEVPVGGDWKAWMLREKNTDDLHKLWFVLLKERNALLTENATCKRRGQEMTQPDRWVKVKKSMARIKFVLHERSLEYKAAKINVSN